MSEADVPPPPKLPDVDSPDPDDVLGDVADTDEIVKDAESAEDILAGQPSVEDIIGHDREP